jgi:hypothetical protein
MSLKVKDKGIFNVYLWWNVKIKGIDKDIANSKR